MTAHPLDPTAARGLTDPVTGSSTFASQHEHLRIALLRARQSGVPLGVVLVDVDDFEAVIRDRGWTAGDAVLRETASRLQEQLRADDTVARMAGDEFVLVCEAVEDPSDLDVVVARVRHALSVPIALPDGLITITIAVGTATSIPSDRPDDLLRRAQGALEAARRRTSPVRHRSLRPIPAG